MANVISKYRWCILKKKKKKKSEYLKNNHFAISIKNKRCSLRSLKCLKMRLFSSDFQTLWRLWKFVIFGIFGILLQTHRYTLSWWVVLSMLVKLVLFTECPMTKTTIENLWIVISFDLMKFPGSFLHKEFVTVQTFVAWKKKPKLKIETILGSIKEEKKSVLIFILPTRLKSSIYKTREKILHIRSEKSKLSNASKWVKTSQTSQNESNASKWVKMIQTSRTESNESKRG